MVQQPARGILADLARKHVRLALSATDLARLGVRVVYQREGEMVVTPPGVVYHWTISVGYTVAEALNFFVQRGSRSAEHLMQQFKGMLPRGGDKTELLAMLSKHIAALG